MNRTPSIVFAGTPDFARHHLEALIAEGFDVRAVLTQPDRKAGRGKKLTPSPVKAAAQDAGITVLQPTSLKSEDDQAALKAFAPDVLVVVAYGLILPQAVLDIPAFGCINVHASLLPRWRGAAPIQRAIEAGDDVSGVTIMEMEAGLDTGPMLATVATPISADETGVTLHDKLATLGPPALINVLNTVEEKLQAATAQDGQLATYASKITKAEAELDWHAPAALLALKIRAFAGTATCFSMLGEARVKLWTARAVDLPDSPPTPGSIVAIDQNGITVACGEGALQVTRAQFPGGRPLSAAELINGHAAELQPGQRFLAGNTL